jgi:hypothetical protein
MERLFFFSLDLLGLALATPIILISRILNLFGLGCRLDDICLEVMGIWSNDMNTWLPKSVQFIII